MPGSRASRIAVASPIPVDAPVTSATLIAATVFDRADRCELQGWRRCPSPPHARGSRFGATRREGERVTPLELFFDLVFVLAITQCTALMAHHPTWSGLAQGLLVLGDPLVGLGRLRLADQRHRPRGGRGAAGHLRRDGGAADRLALRARGVRRPRPHLRPRLRRLPRRPHRPLHARQPRRRRPAPLGPRRSPSAPRSRSACSPPPRSSTASPRARSGRWRSSSTWPGPTSSAPRAGSSSPATSPSATA